MALTQYNAVLIQGNSVPSQNGGQGVQVNTAGDMSYNEFTSYLRAYGSQIGSVSVEANSVAQLSQPFVLRTKDMFGLGKTDMVNVAPNSLLKQLKAEDVPFGDFSFSGLNSMAYKLLPGQSVKITININKEDMVSKFVNSVSVGGGLGFNTQSRAFSPKKKVAKKGKSSKNKTIRKPSHAIIITAYNSSTTDEYNVELLAPAVTNTKQNIPVTGNVVLESGISGVTYTEIIRDLLSRQYIFGYLRIEAISSTTGRNTSAQSEQPLLYKSKNIQGNSITTPIAPAVNLFQRVGNTIDIKIPMLVCNITSLKTNILAGCRVRYYLYPSHIFDAGISGSNGGVPAEKVIENFLDIGFDK